MFVVTYRAEMTYDSLMYIFFGSRKRCAKVLDDGIVEKDVYVLNWSISSDIAAVHIILSISPLFICGNTSCHIERGYDVRVQIPWASYVHVHSK